jgi:hypothetical protein
MAAVFALPATPALGAEFFNTAGQPVAPSIAAADPLQNGQLDGGAATTCGTPPTSTVMGTAPDYPMGGHRSDRYSPFTNHTEQQQCVTVALDPQTCTADSAARLRSAAYVPSFNAASIGANLAGDGGPPAAGASTYGFLVGPGQQLAVVVGNVEPDASCPAYHLALSSALPWATGPMGITGGAVTGEPLSGGATWSGAPSIARQWSRCDVTGAGCAPIDGATGTTYVPTDADVGHTLRAAETADEGGQQASAFALTTPVQSGRPRPAHNRVTVSNTSIVEPATDVVPGSQGAAADDATFDFALPFPVSFYGTEYTRASLGTNGVIQFESSNGSPFNAALPTTRFGPAVLAHWDDLVTTSPTEGIFTSVTGEAPNRVLHVEWRARLYTGGGPVNFEVRMRESSPVISLVYGIVSGAGGSATVGMQAAPTTTLAEPFPFSTPTGLQLDYTSSRPTVAGAAREGAALTGTDAQWIGPGPIATALQWLSCDAHGGDCAEVPGATGDSFTPGAAQVGRRLRLRSTATNERGSTAIVSEPTAPVTAAESPAGPDKTPPVISSLKVSNASFRVARGVTPVSAAAKRRAKAERGTNIRSVVSERGKASYAIQRELRGRQVGKRCVKPARKLRKRKRCWRYRAVQTLTRTVGQGTNVFWFTGRLGSLALIPNRYRVVMRVTDAAGNVSQPRWTRFRIVAR